MFTLIYQIFPLDILICSIDILNYSTRCYEIFQCYGWIFHKYFLVNPVLLLDISQIFLVHPVIFSDISQIFLVNPIKFHKYV